MINGRFSLKRRGRVGRVLADAALHDPLQAEHALPAQCETIGNGHFTVESNGKVVGDMKFPGGRGQVTGEFATAQRHGEFPLVVQGRRRLQS